MIKKDLYLIMCFLLAAALLFIGKETLMHDAGSVTATVDGAPYGSWPLDKNDIIHIGTPYGQNEFTIKNGTVKMTAPIRTASGKERFTPPIPPSSAFLII